MTTPFSANYKALKSRVNARLAHVLVNGIDPERAERWTPDSYAMQAKAIGDIVTGAQRVVGNLTTVDMARKFGGRVAPLGPSIYERDTGIPKAVEYQRPFVVIQNAIRDGKDTPLALQAGLTRLKALTDTDLQMAKVRQAQISLRTRGVQTYRRVTTSGAPCDLCEIAATQVYYTDELMPIHPNCSCDIVPDNFDGNQDEADKFFDGLTNPERDKTQELDDKDAPAKDFRKLIAVRNHGEVGPTLTWKDQHFLGPNDLPQKGITYGPLRFGAQSPEEVKAGQLEEMKRQLRRAVEKGGTKGFRRTATGVEQKEALANAKKLLQPVEQLSPAAQAAADLSAKIGIPVDFDNHKELGAIKGISDAASMMAERYGHVPVKLITSTEDMFHAHAYAETGEFDRAAGETEIHFNPRMMGKPFGTVEETYRKDVASGFHPTTGDRDGATAIYVHEFGHSMDALTGFRASRLAESVLRTKFLDIYDPDRTKYSLQANLRPEMNYREQNELAEKLAAQGKTDYEDWLLKELSYYSFEGGNAMGAQIRFGERPTSVRVNPTEALAEAFSHVELDPDNATDAEKALHQLLVQSSSPQANILVHQESPPPHESVRASGKRDAAQRRAAAIKRVVDVRSAE